jgi:hypothetical protein
MSLPKPFELITDWIQAAKNYPLVVISSGFGVSLGLILAVTVLFPYINRLNGNALVSVEQYAKIEAEIVSLRDRREVAEKNNTIFQSSIDFQQKSTDDLTRNQKNLLSNLEDAKKENSEIRERDKFCNRLWDTFAAWNKYFSQIQVDRVNFIQNKVCYNSFNQEFVCDETMYKDKLASFDSQIREVERLFLIPMREGISRCTSK